MNPWEKIQGPGTLKSIEEEAFSKASSEAKKIPYSKSEIYTAKRRESRRISTLHRVLVKHLKRCYQIGRIYLKAHKFYREIISLYYPEEAIIENTRRVRGLIKVLDELKKEFLHKIELSNDPRDMSRIRKEALGRMISVIKRRSDLIQFFAKILIFAKKLPSINDETPLIVVAGPPNVGKSSLVRLISTAKPEVAEYPFTTKMISLGHFYIDDITVQIMDTPGLLDRPMEERNEIEKQAILALKYVSNLVIFMFDPSPNRYYPIERQKRILEDIMRNFRGIFVIRVVNKIDISDINIDNYFENDVLRISVLTGEGIDKLKTKIEEYIKTWLKRRILD